jgi:hypothetical protein
MQAFSEKDKRTLRFAAIAIAAYLVLFFGFKLRGKLEKTRLEYQQMLVYADRLKREITPIENKFLLLAKLKEHSNIDASKLSRATVVAEASSAIQKAAMEGGIKLGPLRESASRSSGKELASMRIEGMGQIAPIMIFCHKLQSLGYPMVIETLNLAPQQNPPGMLKVNLTVVLFDFEQWKTPAKTPAKGGRNA